MGYKNYQNTPIYQNIPKYTKICIIMIIMTFIHVLPEK